MSWFNRNKREMVVLGDTLSKPSDKQKLYAQLKKSAPVRVDVEMELLSSAIKQAQNPETPNRLRLYLLYEQISHDSQLKSQIRTALISVQKSDFELLKNGKADEKIKYLLETDWFENFIEHSLMAEFWGHSLLEFSALNETGEFSAVSLLPRLHVKPELGEVVLDVNDERGLPYRENATKWALLEIGSTNNLGLLETAAREVIIKNYARSDWSLGSEKFGMPLLKLKSTSRDAKELDKLEEAAQNFASNGYIIIGEGDEAEIIQPPGRNFYEIYKQAIRLCDENISKLINGQTGSSDEKAFVGSAEVHERLLNDYTYSRLRKMQYLINNKLLPFLVYWGYPLADYKFEYVDLRKQTPTALSQPDKNKLSDFFL